MKRLRILALMHPQLVPPDSLEGQTEKDINTWKTEFDVVHSLRELGHEVQPLGVQYELLPIRDAVEQFKPHVVFNLLEEFHGEVLYDQNVVSLTCRAMEDGILVLKPQSEPLFFPMCFWNILIK